MTVIGWDDEVDDVLGGDLAVTLAYPTPASGVVLTPMAPMGLRDRAAGTVTLTSPLGLPGKLVAMRRNPAVAVAYHAREHGDSTSSHVVVVQGRASVGGVDRRWLESITPQWERFLGPRETGAAGRLLATYYWQRVPITIAVERIVVLEGPAHRTVRVLGADLPAEPPAAQAAPAKGTGPRVDVAAVARHLDRLPHRLLSWIGTDGLPVMVPVGAATESERGLELGTPSGALLPIGGRRAGLLGHTFRPRMIGQEHRRCTGWLEVDDTGVHYAPHTLDGFAVPSSKIVFVLGAGLSTRAGMRKARALGLIAAQR